MSSLPHKGRSFFQTLLAITLSSLVSLPTLAFDENEEQNKITVTGYHLKRLDAEGPSPVVTYSKEELEKQGVLSIEDFVRTLNFNIGYQDSTQGSNGPASGAVGLNLRGIGLDSTLVLINGSRVADYKGLSFVDVSTIPWAAIERIEIVKDGASGIYGADALAGVVNFILKDDFEGHEVNLSYSDATDGVGSEVQLDWVYGESWDATSLKAVLSVRNEDAIFKADRYPGGTVDQRFRGGYDWRSFSASPPSVFNFASFQITPSPVCPTEDLLETPFGTACGYDYASDIHQKPEQEYVGLNSFISHQFNDDLSGKLEIGFTDKDQFNQSSPTPIFALLAPSFHPNNPYGTDVFLLYRLLDVGARFGTQDIQTSRFVASLSGETDDFYWDLKVNNSKVDTSEIDSNAINSINLQDSLFGAGGPNADQFYNPFGLNPNNSADVIAGFVEQTSQSNVTDTTTLSFIASTDLFETDAGTSSIAFGIEYREESIKQTFSENIATNSIAGRNSVPPIDVSRDVNSIFTELELPITEAVDAQIALRYEDYQDFGSELSSKVAVRWQLTDSLVSRFSYSETFNAPNFDELYTPPSEATFFIYDPIRCELTGLPEACQATLVTLVNTGNTNLVAEDGESRFVGIVWESESIEGLLLTLDYWSFEHNNRIEFVNGNFVANNFGLDPNLVERETPTQPGDPGRLLSVNQTYLNLDKLTTTGYDLDVNYRWQNELGEWLVGWNINMIDSYEIQDDFDIANNRNEYVGTADFIPLPEFRTSLQLAWSSEQQSLSLLVSTIDGFEDRTNKLLPGTNTVGDIPHFVSSWTTLNINYQYDFTADFPVKIQLGCRNCLDEFPPLSVSQEGGFFSAVHDFRGKMYYVQLNYQF